VEKEERREKKRRRSSPRNFQRLDKRTRHGFNQIRRWRGPDIVPPPEIARRGGNNMPAPVR
jgi:hypothetical protein